MIKYDYLIVGAGLFGATLAYILHKKNKSVIVIERRPNIAGNVYTEKINNIIIHSFGPHIFHTNNEYIWKFVSQLAEFNEFINTPKAYYQGKYYSLPFNMNTFKELWNVNNPKDAKKIIIEQQKGIKHKPKNLEEKAISLVGTEIFEKLIKDYTQKQWGRECKDLPASIITRLPKRYSFNNNYYDDKYQGIPIKGYTYLVEKHLSGIKVVLNEDYILKHEYYNRIANKIIFTGSIDEYYNYCYENLNIELVNFKMNT